MSSAVLIAATGSGAGKTTITLGLLRALTRMGRNVRSAKIGPDYIDPRFHEAATGRPCPNLDPWAMQDGRLAALLAGDAPLVIEGAMGLFDGAGATQVGSAADLAARFGIPIVLIVDCARTAASVAAQVLGFATLDTRLRIRGVILNNVGSDRHEAILRAVMARPAAGRALPPVLGVVRRDPRLAHPSRHLGLVQAGERADLEAWLNQVADILEGGLDLDAIAEGGPLDLTAQSYSPIAPLGQRIAVARDEAFAFAYPHLMDDWQAAGAELLPFSPLNDDSVPEADAVFLPGGYPELHAGRIAGNESFLNSLRNAAQSIDIYGECGGYMVLGDGLTDAEGTRHEMAGLLRLETSFATRKLHLGYRHLKALGGPFAGRYAAHEFHYSTELSARGAPLFSARDADGKDLGEIGLREGRVCGSYAHLIDRVMDGAAPPADDVTQ